MQKGAKILGLFLLGLVFTSMLIGVVSAQFDVGALKIKGFFESIFGKIWSGESVFELAVIKFLFLILVGLLIYPIIKLIPGMKDHPTIQAVVAGIIAFLSVFYIAPGELYGVLQSYTALGITLTAVIPFMILLFFLWDLSLDPSPIKLIIMRLVSVVFSVFLLYRLAIMWGAASVPGSDVWDYAALTYTIILVCVIIVTIWSRKLLQFVTRRRVEGYLEQAKIISKAEATAKIAEMEEMIQASIRFDPEDKTGFAAKLKEQKKAFEKYAREAW